MFRKLTLLSFTDIFYWNNSIRHRNGDPIKGLSSLILGYVVFVFITTGCVPKHHLSNATFRIHEKPVINNDERKQLSLEYLRMRHGINKEQATIEPKMVVVHWTEIYSLESTFDAFNSPRLSGRANLQTASNLNVLAHFLVDRDGTVFRLIPDTLFARHTIGLNYMAIGIENIGGSKAPLTQAQVKSNAELIDYLSRKYNIEYVIGHHEYYDFKKTPLWKETDPNYLTEKVDPGPEFMRELRKELLPLRFKSQPE